MKRLQDVFPERKNSPGAAMADSYQRKAAAATATPASDFSAFNASLRAQQQPQQQQPPQQQHMRTFDDLTTNQLAAPVLSPRAELAALGGLSRMGLPPLPPPAPPSSAAGAGPLGAIGAAAQHQQQAAQAPASLLLLQQQQKQQQQQQQPFDLKNLPALPWDWSVRARLRLASPRPLALVEALNGGEGGGGGGAFEGAADAAAAAAVAASSSATPPTTTTAATSASSLLRAALQQWQHPPGAPLPAAALAAAVAAGRPAREALLASRAQAWRDALRAAFGAVRCGRSPLLYVVCGAAGAAGGGAGAGGAPHAASLAPSSFTVALCGPGAMGTPADDLHAVASGSTRQLRVALDRAGVAYRLVGGGGGVGGAGGAATTAATTTAPAPPPQDGSPASCLLVRGSRHVHGLYCVLLCAPWCEGPGLGQGAGPAAAGGAAASAAAAAAAGAPGGIATTLQDVPTLLSPMPFQGAALCPVPLQALASAPRTAGGGGAAAVFYAEGGGGGGAPIAPWVAQRALAVLGAHALASDSDGVSGCGGGLDAHVDALPGTGMLNVRPHAWSRLFAGVLAPGGAGGAGGIGGAKAEEAQAGTSAPAGLMMFPAEAEAFERHRESLSGRTIKMARWGVGAGGGATGGGGGGGGGTEGGGGGRGGVSVRF